MHFLIIDEAAALETRGRGAHPTPLRFRRLQGAPCRQDRSVRLEVVEEIHVDNDTLRHGKRGTIHQAYRDSMEDQFGSLGQHPAPFRAPGLQSAPHDVRVLM